MSKSYLIVVTIVGGLLLAACGTTSSVAPVSGFAAKSPASIIKISLAAAEAQSSVAATEHSSVASSTLSQTGLASTTSGEQHLTIGTAVGDVIEVGGVVYIKDTAAMMDDQFGVVKKKYVNSWIAIPASNANFARFSQGAEIKSLITEIFPGGKLKNLGTSTVDGVKVVVVRGAPNPPQAEVTGTQTVYVSTVAPYLPLRTEDKGTIESTKVQVSVTFTNWSAKVSVTRPAHFAPIAATGLPAPN
jgi:hypothetical protein